MGLCASKPQELDADLSLLNYQEELKSLYMICVVINPARSRTSIKLYTNFKKIMEKLKVKLITVECALDNSPFSVTTPNYEPFNIQVRTQSSFFQKERLVNIALKKLPMDARYVIVCDPEIEFANDNWVNDSIKALNVFKAVQLFEEAIFLSPSRTESKKCKGFAFQNFKRDPPLERTKFEESTYACGFAWGFRVEAIRDIGGLIDYSPIGNNSKLMAYCLANRIDEYLPKENINENLHDSVKNWQQKAEKIFVHGIGFIPGTVRINYSKINKENGPYERWDILQSNDFDPRNDLVEADHGSYKLEGTKLKLISDLKDHFTNLNGENID
jgi:hypothetical protein